MKQGSRSLWCFVKTYPVFALFIASYTVIHGVFECSFGLTSGDAILGESWSRPEAVPCRVCGE